MESRCSLKNKIFNHNLMINKVCSLVFFRVFFSSIYFDYPLKMISVGLAKTRYMTTKIRAEIRLNAIKFICVLNAAFFSTHSIFANFWKNDT